MEPFKFPLESSKPFVDVKGGVVRFAKKLDFPKLDGLAIASIQLQPGAIRIPHWHPNANEMDYVISGNARIDLFGPADGPNPDGVSEQYNVGPGEISFLPQGWFHSITNAGPGVLHILVIFNSDSPLDIGLPRGLGGIEKATLAKSLGITVEEVEKFHTSPEVIVPV